jgi:uncharacterized Zn-binding protein involved in type VI secretion
MGELKLRTCSAHGVETRLDCASCGEPICLRCEVETERGLLCERCARGDTLDSSAPRRARSIATVAAGVALLALAAVFLRMAVSSHRSGSAPPGRWERAPDLSVVRGSTSAVRLRDGRVLVAGGGIGAIPLAGAEVYDPATHQWSRTADLRHARRGSAMVLLADGRVLIAGGLAGDQVLASAEIFDPARGAWTETAPMGEARLAATLTELADGRVLAAGGTGSNGRALSSAEVFDPASSTWTTVPTGMRTPRSNAAAVALDDGRVLVVGGVDNSSSDGNVLASTELFDPVADVFTATGGLSEGRQDLSATRLSDGRVLVAGGANAGGILNTAEIFDPARGSWTRTGSMVAGRRLPGTSALPDGRIILAGGESSVGGARTTVATAELYDPSTGRWRAAASMACPRTGPAQVTLGDGTVLVAGGDAALPGQPPAAQSCAEVFVPPPRRG